MPVTYEENVLYINVCFDFLGHIVELIGDASVDTGRRDTLWLRKNENKIGAWFQNSDSQ